MVHVQSLWLQNFRNYKEQEIVFGLGTTVTTDLKAGKYFYDLLLSAPTGLTEKGVQGTAIVKKSVTRI